MAEVRTVTAEMHIVAQCVAVSSVHFSYIADTYSNRFALETESEDVQFTDRENELQSREMFRDSLETATPVRSVVSITVHTGLPMHMQEGRKTADRDTCICFSSVSLGRRTYFIVVKTSLHQKQASRDAQAPRSASPPNAAGKCMQRPPEAAWRSGLPLITASCSCRRKK